MTNLLWVQPEDLGHYANTEFALEACETASYLLWSMSGRKFSGITTVTERYTSVPARLRLGAAIRTVGPVLFNGNVYHVQYDDYEEYVDMDPDGLTVETKVRLRGRPVREVLAVRNRFGNFLDPSSYYLTDHSTLRIKSGAEWPPYNTEVTYTYGSPPPVAGKMAARTLALELAKLWSGDEDCALPQRITSVTRQGVSFTILDQQDFIDELKTGVYAVDLFLKTVNPDKARARSRVFSVDVPRGRRYTPKPLVYPADTTKDLAVTRNGASVTLPLADISAEFLISGEGWQPSVSVFNWAQSQFKDVPGAATVDVDNETITVDFEYNDISRTIGLVDPGSYEVYGTRPNPENPEVTDVILIYSANLKVNTRA